MSDNAKETDLDPMVEDVPESPTLDAIAKAESSEVAGGRISPSSTPASEDQESEAETDGTMLTEEEDMSETFETIVQGDTHFVLSTKGARTQRLLGLRRIADRSKDSSREEIETLVTASGFEIVAVQTRASSCSMPLLCGSSMK
jgi:hypothetical protein